MDTQFDRSTLKLIVREILIEEPELLNSLIDEVIRENYLKREEEDVSREDRLTQMINDDFAKYDTVFKDLA